jgi:hypothetical protein
MVSNPRGGIYMENISTLEAFDNLVSAGVPEAQARAQVLTLNKSLDHLATKQDLAHEIKSSEYNLKVFLTGEIVAAVIIFISLPAFWRFLNKAYGFNKRRTV